MVKNRRRPATANMAIIALATCLNMIGGFARGSATIVALKTVATDLGMIHSLQRRPGVDAMTRVASIA
jgi:hypothetical protein